MPETKSRNVMVNLEPTVAETMLLFLAREGISASSYCRRLIIKDLSDRGLLTDEIIVRMITR